MAPETAFHALVDRAHPRLFRVAARITGNAAEAEDVVQEAFLRTFRSVQRGALPIEGATEPRLLKVVTHLSLNHLRGHRRAEVRQQGFAPIGTNAVEAADARVALAPSGGAAERVHAAISAEVVTVRRGLDLSSLERTRAAGAWPWVLLIVVLLAAAVLGVRQAQPRVTKSPRECRCRPELFDSWPGEPSWLDVAAQRFEGCPAESKRAAVDDFAAAHCSWVRAWDRHPLELGEATSAPTDSRSSQGRRAYTVNVSNQLARALLGVTVPLSCEAAPTTVMPSCRDGRYLAGYIVRSVRGFETDAERRRDELRAFVVTHEMNLEVVRVLGPAAPKRELVERLCEASREVDDDAVELRELIRSALREQTSADEPCVSIDAG
jgi:RNA polymerase sigma-70 factor (ECF subfamily)